MKTEIQLLTDTLSHTFEKNAWHGPAVLEAIADLTQETGQKRVNDSHSIVELIAHMTTWRNFVSEKLEGNNEFDVTDEANFPAETNWANAVAALKKSQQRLLNALTRTPVERLDEKVPGRQYKFRVMLNGIIHHDLYHTGQIMIIKKTAIR